MMEFNKQDFQTMEKRYRTRLINTLSGFKSVNLVGTRDSAGKNNLSIISSVVHLGANPALMGFVSRPISVTRDTHSNILETGFFTFNHITVDFYKAAHQTSARYPSEVSEFEAVGLTPEFKNDFVAPFVAESPIQIGLEFKQQIEIEMNGTILMIGEVVELFVPEDCLLEDGFLDIEKAGSITCSGLDTYYAPQKLTRLSYAKPEKELKDL